MRRISVFVVGIIVTAVMLPLAGIAAETQKEVSLDASEQVILRLLSQPTTDAVYDYYGEYRQYWRQEILSIQKVPQSQYYEVITRIETFYGAHNPPYGLAAFLPCMIWVRFRHRNDSFYMLSMTVASKINLTA